MWNRDEIRALYEAIPHRKSVRKYTKEPLADSIIAESQDALDKTRLIFEDTPIAFQILDSNLVKRKFSTENASYVAVYADRNPKA